MQKFVAESWLVVSLSAVFAVLLAGTQVALRSTIVDNESAALKAAIAEVIPNYDEHVASMNAFKHEEAVDGKALKNDIYQCLGSDGQAAAWAIVGEGTGFVDKIKLVIGLSADHKSVTGIKVIQSVETPGLGDKILSGSYPEQYAGLSAEQPVIVSKTGADPEQNVIQAITGATYSSEYTADIVNDILTRVVPKLDSLKPDDADSTSQAQEE